MVICYINPDGSHVRDCDLHVGEHPWDWCREDRERRTRRMQELEQELAHLREEARNEYLTLVEDVRQ